MGGRDEVYRNEVNRNRDEGKGADVRDREMLTCGEQGLQSL